MTSDVFIVGREHGRSEALLGPFDTGAEAARWLPRAKVVALATGVVPKALGIVDLPDDGSGQVRLGRLNYLLDASEVQRLSQVVRNGWSDLWRERDPGDVMTVAQVLEVVRGRDDASIVAWRVFHRGRASLTLAAGKCDVPPLTRNIEDVVRGAIRARDAAILEQIDGYVFRDTDLLPQLREPELLVRKVGVNLRIDGLLGSAAAREVKEAGFTRSGGGWVAKASGFDTEAVERLVDDLCSYGYTVGYHALANNAPAKRMGRASASAGPQLMLELPGS